jgi:hypothetical protein
VEIHETANDIHEIGCVSKTGLAVIKGDFLWKDSSGGNPQARRIPEVLKKGLTSLNPSF